MQRSRRWPPRKQQLEVAKANQQHYSALGDYARITAPYDGVVTWRYRRYRFAGAGRHFEHQRRCRWSRWRRSNVLRLRIPVPESMAAKVRMGDSADVHVQATGEHFTGKVARFTDALDTSTRTMQVEIDVPNPNYHLQPGMYADVRAQRQQPHRRAHRSDRVPFSASDNKTTVLVVDAQNRVQSREVQTRSAELQQGGDPCGSHRRRARDRRQPRQLSTGRGGAAKTGAPSPPSTERRVGVTPMSSFAIKYPFFILMLCLAIVVVGVTTVARMPVDLFPPIKIPVVVVATFYSGMPPQQIEANITDTFERFFTLGSNIDHIESRSLTGVSLIKVYFQPGTDADAAVSEIANLAMADLRRLPQGTLPPVVLKFDASSLPVCLVTLKGQGLNETQLHDLGQFNVRNQIANVPGASVPQPYGGKYRQIQFYVDPVKLEAAQTEPDGRGATSSTTPTRFCPPATCASAPRTTTSTATASCPTSRR